ncbi:MAG: MarR family transcriptional regulator [Flavobacteriales bacterium]|nr:MarR family transcriptional regulator [Flavobacteriales bacterium]
MPGIDQELQSRFTSEQQKALLNVLFTANWLRSHQVSRFKPYGISAQQYNILRILRGAKDRMRAQSVKERMIDRAPNATRLTDKLIDKGLVARERCDEDRRVIYVRITPKGLSLLDRIDSDNKDAYTALFERLTVSDAKAINAALDRWRG